MADYTKINLDDIKDLAKDNGFEGNHEARFPSKDLGLKQAGLGYEIIYPGKHIPFGHTHKEQEEVYVILGGNGQVKIDGETVDVKEHDAIRIGPETNRAFKANDNEKLVLLIFGAPKTEGQDANMKSDPWEEK